ncbi:MAG: phage tail sheath family protein [Planctomycetaceae bacterium]|nr:phage tail sheath family protein [Planctomycetaceae bacterium]
MVQFNTPGVYLIEEPTTPPIQGVSTSIASFIGVVHSSEVKMPATAGSVEWRFGKDTPVNNTDPTAPFLSNTDLTRKLGSKTDPKTLLELVERRKLIAGGIIGVISHRDATTGEESRFSVALKEDSGTKTFVLKPLKTASPMIPGHWIESQDPPTGDALKPAPAHAVRLLVFKKEDKNHFRLVANEQATTFPVGAKLWFVQHLDNDHTKNKPFQIKSLNTQSDEVIFEGPKQPEVPASDGVPDSFPQWKEEKKTTSGTTFQEFRPLTPAGQPVLITSFDAYLRFFGQPYNAKHERIESEFLAQAVRGFFQNGGSRCWVARLENWPDLDLCLNKFDRIDEISLMALAFDPENAKANTIQEQQNKVFARCEKLGDRFAILNGNYQISELTPDAIDTGDKGNSSQSPDPNDHAAVYFPWLKVRSMVAKDEGSEQYKEIAVPPCGHLAGIYARSDARVGVHKAPANEGIRGVLGTVYHDGTEEVPGRITGSEQGDLNLAGVNVLREFTTGQVTVWGARTWSSQQPAYVNIRRYMNYLKESIQKSTQFAVFQPNTEALWQRLVRSTSGFLYMEWRNGALFGSTEKQAYFVRCDEALNTSEVRQRGQVIVEVGVSLVYPAEFVVFHISQEVQAS